MKYTPNLLLLAIALLLPIISVSAQTLAVTEYGDTIFVYDNGTWSYDMLDEMPEQETVFDYLNQELDIVEIEAPFTTPAKAQKVLTAPNDMFDVKYDASVWKRVPPATLNEDATFAIQGKERDIWCVVIAEETEISKDKLLLIAKNTLDESSGKKSEILSVEARNVNGTDLLRGVLKADLNGLVIVFDSYYYSNDAGSVQFVTWTTETVWKRNQEMIHDLLNGFVVK
ncbi:hypothetical protein [Lewinella sp. 4G2]|uniref:hypothetical protein n=1 Tax=Lewinella sp. 4G2 TaxID=1803372 RepID=UPI0007B46C20|nr:hypothetical protein [Lewinella sp. 4G2]OAV45200.1 hypothetical protein A3850_012160 [Lewinella sp. 4G2]